MTNNHEFVYVLHIATTAENLWEALTSGEFTQKYWGGRRIESTWQVGSPVHHWQADGTLDWKGEVLTADRPKTLAYTFDCHDMHTPDEPPSRVTFTLSESGPGTIRLQVVHDQLVEKTHQSISNGWPAILSNLKTLLERGEGLEYFWKG